MGGKRKRNLVAPGSSINKTPRPLPTQYDFVSKATTSNLPPVVLPNNNPAPSVRDYPPPRQLFPCSTFQPSGSAPVPQTQPPTRVPQSSGGEGTSYPQPGRRQSQSPPLRQQWERAARHQQLVCLNVMVLVFTSITQDRSPICKSNRSWWVSFSLSRFL